MVKLKEEFIFCCVFLFFRGVLFYEDMEILVFFSILMVIYLSFYCILDFVWLKFLIYGIILCGKVWKKNGKMFMNVLIFFVNCC